MGRCCRYPWQLAALSLSERGRHQLDDSTDLNLNVAPMPKSRRTFTCLSADFTSPLRERNKTQVDTGTAPDGFALAVVKTDQLATLQRQAYDLAKYHFDMPLSGDGTIDPLGMMVWEQRGWASRAGVCALQAPRRQDQAGCADRRPSPGEPLHSLHNACAGGPTAQRNCPHSTAE